MFKNIRAIFRGDPAAKNIFEVLMYQGLWAIWFHHVAHFLYLLKVPVLPRFISQLSRFFTQIEIHPGARIEPGVFIDHGNGVVIGETAEIGANSILYHQVTLGGTGLYKGKRHPTIGQHCVIGAGAKVLGNITVGDNCRIGASSVVTKSMPPNCTVVGNPGRIVKQEGVTVDQELEHGLIPDPCDETCGGLKREIEELRQEIKLLKNHGTSNI